MVGALVVSSKLSFQNATGGPLANGTLTVYVAGTTTLTPTWQDQAQTVFNSNPITLDARGECTIWLDSLINYKFLLKDSVGTTIWTVDNILPSLNVQAQFNTFTASVTSQLATFQPQIDALNAQTAKLSRLVWVDDYGTNTVPGTTDMTSAINAAIAAVADGGTVMFTPNIYRTTSMIAPISRNGIVLQGSGTSVSTGGNFTSAQGTRIQATHSDQAILSLAQCNGFKISNITLIGSTGNPRAGLVLGASRGYHYFEKFNIIGSFSVCGLYIVGSLYNIFIDCIIVTGLGALCGVWISSDDPSGLFVGLPMAGGSIPTLSSAYGTLSNKFISCVLGTRVSTGTPPVGYTGVYLRANGQRHLNTEFDNCQFTVNGGSLSTFVRIDQLSSAGNLGSLQFRNCRGVIEGASGTATNAITVQGIVGATVHNLNCDFTVEGSIVSNLFNMTSDIVLISPTIKTNIISGSSTDSTFGVIRGGDLNFQSENNVTIASLASSSLIWRNNPPTITTDLGGNIVRRSDGTLARLTRYSISSDFIQFTRSAAIDVFVNAAAGDIQYMTNTNGTNFSFGTPINANNQGQRLTLIVNNNVGVAVTMSFIGTLRSNGTLVVNANQGCTITFVFVLGVWIEVSRSTSFVVV